jgi:peptide/nickel transport system substrate-binding protein
MIRRILLAVCLLATLPALGWSQTPRIAPREDGDVDPVARRGFYEIALHRPREDLPLIYPRSPVNVVGMSAKPTGFLPIPDGMIRLQGLAMTK